MNTIIYNTLERIANGLRYEIRLQGTELGLLPVQHEALQYLTCCNRYSDTLAALTDYLGLTKGTVSQTVKVLEAKDLITKLKDPIDKRVTHLQITASGREYLAKTNPPELFLQALESLSEQQKTELKQLLDVFLRSYHNHTKRNQFGICAQCHYHLKLENGLQCGLTKDSLSDEDARLICREFTER